MGYKIIRPMKGGVQSKESIHVSKSRISFTKAFYTRAGLTARKKCAILYEDTETETLCFDFKDAPFRDAFTVSVSIGKKHNTTVCIYAEKTIKLLGLSYGNYSITGQDGTIFKTDIKINRQTQ